MIQISKTNVSGFEAAIRGMRNPMNSWDKSDSVFTDYNGMTDYIGKNDFELMMKLSKAGNDHGKFLRMINVSMDINAPLYWWKEFDTYKVGTVANSCSTMHKIHSKEFTLDDFSCEHLMTSGTEILMRNIKHLNDLRDAFNNYEVWDNDGYAKPEKKTIWYSMIQLLPSSYNQKRTVVLNYAVLKNMYHARKEHKLDEWRMFCRWIEQLPYAELITKTV